MSGQPIDTAPQDGRTIIVRDESGDNITRAYWDETVGMWCHAHPQAPYGGPRLPIMYSPSHWAEVPDLIPPEPEDL